MADQLVITEKTSQARDVRAAVGSRYGDILPAEGHLLDLLDQVSQFVLQDPAVQRQVELATRLDLAQQGSR